MSHHFVHELAIVKVILDALALPYILTSVALNVTIALLHLNFCLYLYD